MEPTLDYDTWTGRDAYDCDGDKIGTIDEIYYDDVSGRPEWIEVDGRLIPLAGATVARPVRDDDEEGAPDFDDDDDERLVVAFNHGMVNDAPRIDNDEHLSPEQERELYAYYGFDHSNRTDNDFGYGKAWDAPRFDKDYTKRDVGAIGKVGTEDRGTVAAEATVRNQEAQVVSNTEQVRLRKYTHTEMVPVTKEEVRVERVTDDKENRNA